MEKVGLALMLALRANGMTAGHAVFLATGLLSTLSGLNEHASCMATQVRLIL